MEELIYGLLAEKERATSNIILDEPLRALSLLVFYGI
jgi:hypothetical protein